MSEAEKTSPVGAMNPAKIEKIVAQLSTRAPNSGACQVCKNGRYTIAPHLVTPLINQEEGLLMGGPSYPQVMLICGNCGHTRYHNVIALGVENGVDE